MQVLSEKTPTARKVHNCDLCSTDINIGEKYIRQSNENDGSVYDFIMHESCQELATVMKMYEDTGGVNETDFCEYVMNKFDELCDENLPFEQMLKTVKEHYEI